MATIKKPAKKMQMGGVAPTPKKFTPKGPVKEIKKAFLTKPKTSEAATEKFKSSPLRDVEMKFKKPGMKKGGVVKAKKGGSFPDLNKDGKITKADILKGRGVIAKKGAKVKAAGMKKCKYGCK